MGGMGGVGGSGGDAGGDAVTVVDILNLPKVLTDEKFQKAEEELLAAAERLQNHKAKKNLRVLLDTMKTLKRVGRALNTLKNKQNYKLN